VAGTNAWTPLGPDGGRVYDVEFSQASPGTFYAAGVSGVYRSTVAGDSFELLKEDFGQSPFDVAIDPQAERLLVAADGLYVRGGSGWTVTRPDVPEVGTKVETSRDGATAYFAAGTRIFRSLDRGATWQERAPIPSALPSQLVNGLETDPTNASVVYASVFGLGLFASSDGAGSWRQLVEGAIAHIFSFTVDPSNPQRLLVATDGGLHVSDDRGVTWKTPTLTADISDVEVDPRDSRVIYVAGADFRKSTDGGATWTVLTVDQPSGFFKLTIDPTEPSRLAAFGGEGVSVSTDAGATWAKRIAGFKGTSPSAFSPLASSRRHYFGVNSRGGVYYVEAGDSTARSVNNDPLAMLAGAPQGLVDIQVLALPGAADRLYAVLRGQVLAKSIDAGQTWSQVPFPAPAVHYVAGSPLEPLTLFAAGSPGNVFKSLDGGANWLASGAGLPADVRIERLAIASTPSTLYAIGIDESTAPEWGIYRSSDGGTTWAAASPTQTRPILSITVDPNDAQVVYAGFDSELRKTTDGGATWTTLSYNNGPPLCCSFLGVAFDAANRNVFYAQHSDIWRTVDGGASWESVRAPRYGVWAAPGTLALDPTDSSRLLVGWTELGVRELTIAPDLELTLGAPASLTPDVRTTYTVTLSNRGPFRATDVRVTAQLPAGSTAPSASAPGAVCTLAATTATCSFDVLRTGGAATPITLSFIPTAGSATVTAAATAAQPDPTTSNNAVSSTLTAVVAAPASSGGGGGGAISLEVLMLLIASLWRRRLMLEKHGVSPPGSRRDARV
jgi:uncharacterized repeat protein (TIGR01451 family)